MRRGKLRVTRGLLLGFLFVFSFSAESLLYAQMLRSVVGEFSNGVPVQFADSSSGRVSTRTFDSASPALHPAEESRASGNPSFAPVSANSQFPQALNSSQTLNSPQTLDSFDSLESRVGVGEGKKLFSGSEASSASVSGEKSENQEKKSKSFPSSVGVKKLAFSVAVVALLFFVLLLILKKFSPQDAPKLPRDAFEILGKSQLAFRHQLYLLRCGEKLFVVSISQNGVDRIGEIDDPEEADRLTRLCRGEVLGAEKLKNFEERRASRDSGEASRKSDA